MQGRQRSIPFVWLVLVLLTFVCTALADASKDYYAILGVDKKTPPAEIKAKYRTLARKFHPDKAKGSEKEKERAQKRFMEIAEAADVLGDEEKRKQYDMEREMLKNGGGAFAGGQFGAHPNGFGGAQAGNGNVRYTFHSTGGNSADTRAFEEIFRNFGGMFGGAGSQQGGPHTANSNMDMGDILNDMLKQKSANANHRGPGKGKPANKSPPPRAASKKAGSSTKQTSKTSPPPPRKTSCALKCNGVKCSRQC